MLILKNLFIFVVSIFAISLLIIIFDRLGVNKYVNLFTAALIYGAFITIYFQKIFLSLSFFFGFYTLLFMISYSIDVLIMLFISCAVLFSIKFVMPKLKNAEIDHIFSFNKLYKKWFFENYFLYKSIEALNADINMYWYQVL